MNKRLFSILFTLFLAGVLSVSCSNKDKTSQSTGIDSKYAGTWIGGEGLTGQTIVINADGSAKNQTQNVDIPASSITKNSDTSYTANYTFNPNTGVTVKGTMNIEFTTETSANLKIDIVITGSDNTANELTYSGTLTRQ